jgi:hypothetical protein
MITFVSSVLLRLPAAHTNAESVHLIRQTTPRKNELIKIYFQLFYHIPPLPADSSATRFRMKSPVFKSHNLTYPSSPELTT